MGVVDPVSRGGKGRGNVALFSAQQLCGLAVACVLKRHLSSRQRLLRAYVSAWQTLSDAKIAALVSAACSAPSDHDEENLAALRARKRLGLVPDAILMPLLPGNEAMESDMAATLGAVLEWLHALSHATGAIGAVLPRHRVDEVY
jgi:hypothetical protein